MNEVDGCLFPTLTSSLFQFYSFFSPFLVEGLGSVPFLSFPHGKEDHFLSKEMSGKQEEKMKERTVQDICRVEKEEEEEMFGEGVPCFILFFCLFG